jgi:hypothetical protein
MILKGSIRGTPEALGRHLTNSRDNDLIEVHQVDGFISQDVQGAFAEIATIAKGVKSNKPLFSVSLSPPQDKNVGTEVFEDAICRIEGATGLTGQPRIVVFHTKDGRRHAHCVWSRVDPETMTVIPHPFFKRELNVIAKDMYLEHGWNLPAGFIDRAQRDPRNFDLATYQQAKREGIDPKQLKTLALEAWSISDNRASLEKALEERGLYLAKGDRRAYTVMSWQTDEVYALARLTGKKTREIRERLGDESDYRTVDDAKAHIQTLMQPTWQRLLSESDAQRDQALAPIQAEANSLKAHHLAETQLVKERQQSRAEAENRERSERLQKSFWGKLWQQVSGKAAEIIAQNQREAYAALKRDEAQRQAITDAQLRESQALKAQVEKVRQEHEQRHQALLRDMSRLQGRDPEPVVKATEQAAPAVQPQPKPRIRIRADMAPSPESVQAAPEPLRAPPASETQPQHQAAEPPATPVPDKPRVRVQMVAQTRAWEAFLEVAPPPAPVRPAPVQPVPTPPEPQKPKPMESKPQVSEPVRAETPEGPMDAAPQAVPIVEPSRPEQPVPPVVAPPAQKVEQPPEARPTLEAMPETANQPKPEPAPAPARSDESDARLAWLKAQGRSSEPSAAPQPAPEPKPQSRADWLKAQQRDAGRGRDQGPGSDVTPER